MNDAHASALALIKELYALDATEVSVGDVRAVFVRRAPEVAAELPPHVAEELTALRAENEALSIYRKMVEDE